MPAPHEEAVLLETYLAAMEKHPVRREPPPMPVIPAEPLPPLDAETKRRIRAITLAANDRYVQAFLEEYSICPFSRGGRLQGQTVRYVHFAESTDATPVAELMATVAAQPDKVVAQVIFPMLDIAPDAFRQFCHDITSAANARLGPLETYAVAPLHPGLSYNPHDPYTIIPLFRRSPDPTIQWVRLDALESIYAGRSDKDVYVHPSEIAAYLAKPKKKPLFDTIAETNLKMAMRLGINRVEEILDEISLSTREACKRVLLGEEDPDKSAQEASGPPVRCFEHRTPLAPDHIEGDRVALASLRSLPLHIPVRFLAENVEVVAIRRKEDTTVFYGRCPHRAAPLDVAIVEDDRIVCPYHGWDFRLTDGKSEGVPGEGVHRFQAEVSAGFVWLSLDELHRVRNEVHEIFEDQDLVL